MGRAGRRRRRLEAAQLVGVHDAVEGGDVGAIGGEGGDAVDGAVEQVGEEGGVAVDAGEGVAMVGAPLAVDGEEESDDAGAALEDFAGGSDFAAAVGGEGDGFGEEGEQGVGVVAVKGGEEAFEELMLDLGGDGAPRAAVAHAGVRAMDHLAAHGLALAEEGGELGVGDVEELAQEKGGALFGVETLEEGDEREGEVGSALEGVIGREGVGRKGLGEPRADIGSALGGGAAQAIDAQTADDGDEPVVGILESGAVGGVPAEIRVLHRVFRVGARAEHAVREGEEARTVALEGDAWVGEGRRFGCGWAGGVVRSEGVMRGAGHGESAVTNGAELRLPSEGE